MNIQTLLVAAAAGLQLVGARAIDHDKVQPFAQPNPVTSSEKTAITFKPSLRIDSGCHPYPAVNAAGETSAGLKGSGFPSGMCKGSSLGSQIYGRAVWYGDLWAIMYAWYFPKDKPASIFTEGQRHDWASVVVWLNDPAVERPTMIGVSPSSYVSTYYKYTPPPRDGVHGTTCMINYLQDVDNHGFHTVDTTWKSGGEFQDLIMWEQLTDEARAALNDTDFGENAKVPFNDANFQANLQNAWPY
ncbi:Necrosis inducing-like protein NPP1 type [Phytophthora palmivora]|uniref:Necrosis inducing-like protein NPP1 type n=1 Tax=Phytophthora palmivora TaxID=4796 RepID=A0A2P4Y5B0_9STRA|nr:Necrosis inducing-like protein NPP1 type [Phytophthora palmivora]